MIIHLFSFLILLLSSVQFVIYWWWCSFCLRLSGLSMNNGIKRPHEAWSSFNQKFPKRRGHIFSALLLWPNRNNILIFNMVVPLGGEHKKYNKQYKREKNWTLTVTQYNLADQLFYVLNSNETKNCNFSITVCKHFIMQYPTKFIRRPCVGFWPTGRRLLIWVTMATGGKAW